MKKITILAIIAALLCGILLYGYLNSMEKRVTEAEAEHTVVPQTVPVVVAASDIPPFVDITDEMLTLKEFPVDVVPETAALSFEEVVGLQSGATVVKDAMLFRNAVGTPEEIGTCLSYLIPEGMRAMTLTIDYETGVAGHLTEGDHVDVLQYMVASPVKDEDEEEETGDEEKEPLDSITVSTGEKREMTPSEVCILLENVEVLKLGEKGWNREEQGMYSFITLALTPEQTLDLMNAQHRGDCVLGIALRGRGDTQLLNLPIYAYTETMERLAPENTNPGG